MARHFGIGELRWQGEQRRPAHDRRHPYLALQHELCISCGRCVRACDEVQGAFALTATGRGFHSGITAGLDSGFEDSTCVSCGACADTCPTDAITEHTLLDMASCVHWTRRHRVTSRFDATTTTTCGYCGVGCRLEAHRSDGRIASISPAMDGPANKGHTCVKGRFAHQFARSRDRLTAPLVRESGGFRLASWDEAIGRIADALGRIKAEHGPDAIAGLASSRATNEDCYVMQRLMRAAIGTHNIDNCSRVCHSPTSFALRKSFGMSGATGSFDDIEAADVALLIGVNPTQGHPVVGARIKQAAIKGLKLITADPRRIELADYGQLHLGMRPGTNAALLNGLAHVVIRDGLVNREFVEARTEGYEELAELVEAYTPEAVEEITSVPAADLVRRRAHVRDRGARLHPLGPRRHRAPLRLGVRAADLQPGAADRQRRPAGRRPAAAARAEQRAGLVGPRRAAGHVHGLPARSRRRGHLGVRAALGREDEARARDEDPGDVRRRRRGSA